MDNPIKILHLEDNPNDAILVRTMLEKSKIRFDYYLCDNEETFHTLLSDENVDIILSDYHLPDYNGNDALIWAREQYSHIPFIFISGTMGEEAAIESLLNGATDYVLKNKMERLGSAVNRAISEAKVQKARVLAEREVLKLSRAVEQSPNSIVITDVNGTIEYVNANTAALTGYTSEEVIGKNPRIFKTGNTSDEEYSKLWETITSGKTWSGEFMNKKKNGELYWESASISPILDLQGKIVNYLGIKTDITEKKKLLQELIAAKEKAEESDRLKTSFLNNISHEIRTPMNAIVGFAEFLNEPDLTSEKRKEFSDIIIQSTKQLLSIITDIIDIAAIEAGQEKTHLTEFDLNYLLRIVYEQSLMKAAHQDVELRMQAGMPQTEIRLVCDQTKLSQILNNLIGNALKFTKKGHVVFGYEIKGEEIEFSVHDTGIGIAAEMHDEIFKRFRQVESTLARKFGGSGLGLSIAKAFVELLGGKIWLTSEPGKGSSFYFTIPYNKAPQSDVAGPSTKKTTHFRTQKPKTLLIAEDEDSNFMLLRELLSDFNITIIRANNGREAIEMCRSQLIDLVLMDIKMPEMDGYEATKLIREFMPDLPIIAQTAYSANADKEKALASGCSDYIGKPISREILITKIKALIEKS